VREFEERPGRRFWLTAVEDRPAGEVRPRTRPMTPGAVRVAKVRARARRLRGKSWSEIPEGQCGSCETEKHEFRPRFVKAL